MWLIFQACSGVWCHREDPHVQCRDGKEYILSRVRFVVRIKRLTYVLELSITAFHTCSQLSLNVNPVLLRSEHLLLSYEATIIIGCYF